MRSSTSSAIAAGALVLLASMLSPVSALYIYITDGQQKCFIEEVPAETLIVGTYKNPDFVPFGRPDFTGVGIKLNVQDPANNIVMTKQLDVEGKFAFTSAAGGEYQLCFSTNSSRWFGGQPKKFRFDLKLDVGETGIDYQEVAKREHLSDLEVEVSRLTFY
jgi:p24 family protein alpha